MSKVGQIVQKAETGKGRVRVGCYYDMIAPQEMASPKDTGASSADARVQLPNSGASIWWDEFCIVFVLQIYICFLHVKCWEWCSGQFNATLSSKTLNLIAASAPLYSRRARMKHKSRNRIRTMDSILIMCLADLSCHNVPEGSSSGCSRLISIFFRWFAVLQTSKRISTVLHHPLASSNRFITNSTRRIFFNVSWLINSVMSMGLPNVIV